MAFIMVRSFPLNDFLFDLPDIHAFHYQAWEKKQLGGVTSVRGEGDEAMNGFGGIDVYSSWCGGLVCYFITSLFFYSLHASAMYAYLSFSPPSFLFWFDFSKTQTKLRTADFISLQINKINFLQIK